jgi:hypothetical protein
MTDLDYGSYRLPDLEMGFTAGFTGGQGMLTPPTHPNQFRGLCLPELDIGL